MSSSPVSSPTAPAALAAFLRGVERRGAVLAELQCGDAGDGDAALSTAMRQFRGEAAELALAEWPRRFWALLLMQPRLRYRSAVAVPLDATDRLAELGSGPRAALLLRLAAGLDETEAAAALGVAAPAYRLALQRALPHHADGRADPASWQRLREQIHRRIKTLPPERLLRLAQAREDALRGVAAAAPAAQTSSVSSRPRPRWLLPLLWALLSLCALALAASFWWPAGGPFGGSFGGLPGAGAEAGRVDVQALAAAEAPAERYDDAAGRLAHRDFALLADPDGEAQARDLDFYSWLVAGDAGTRAPPTLVLTAPSVDAAAGEPPAPVATAPDNAGLETVEETPDAPR